MTNMFPRGIAQAGSFAGLSDAREGASWFYEQVVPIPAGVPHAVERYLSLADAVLDQKRERALRRVVVASLLPGEPVEV